MIRTWRARAFVAVAAAVVGFGLLIPERRAQAHWSEWEWQEFPEVLEKVRSYRALRLRTTELRLAVERVEVRAAIRTATARLGLTVTRGAGVPESARLVAERAASAELAVLGVSNPAHPVVVLVEADTTLWYGTTYRRMVVFPQARGDACGVVVRVHPRRLESLAFSTRDRVLGACAFAARFGTPGAGMMTWMRETRMLSAGYVTPPSGLSEEDDLVDLDRGGGLAWFLRGCRAGDPMGCERLFTPRRDDLRLDWGYEIPWDEAMWEHGDVAEYGPAELYSISSVVTQGLLSALAEDVGERRFASIWASEDPPAVAFERFENRRLADWVGERVARYVEPYQRGPGPGALGLALGILFVGIGVGLSVRFSPRQMS